MVSFVQILKHKRGGLFFKLHLKSICFTLVWHAIPHILHVSTASCYSTCKYDDLKIHVVWWKTKYFDIWWLYRKPLNFATPKFRDPCLISVFVGNVMGKGKQCLYANKLWYLTCISSQIVQQCWTLPKLMWWPKS